MPLPQPLHRLGKELRRVLAVVPTLAPLVLHLVPGERQRPLHRLVRHPPVAAIYVQVLAAVLEEDADRPRLELADQPGVLVAAAQAHVGADGGEDASERVRPFPGRGERADRARTRAADGPVVTALGQNDLAAA